MNKKYISIYSQHKLIIKPATAHSEGSYVQFINCRYETADPKKQSFLAAVMKKEQGVIFDVSDGESPAEKEAAKLKRELAESKAELAAVKGKKGLVSATIAEPSKDDE